MDTTQKQTAQGLFLKLAYLQQAIVDYNKKKMVLVKSWDQTCAFFVTKDIEYKDNQEDFSSAGITNSSVTSGILQQV